MTRDSLDQSDAWVYDRSPAKPPTDDAQRLVLEGKSRAYQFAIDQLRRFARWSDPIVIEGESGTGKTELARQVHAWSPRAGATFKEFSLADVSDSVASSALFGHVRGAYTDASYARDGFFRAAQRGTLFLDELGKASLDVQRKLLRVVESGRMYPVGSDTEIRLDVRLIFATSVPMKELVEAGLLLRDLYARLRVLTIRLPAIRERPEDVPDLIQYFLSKHGRLRGYDTAPALAPDARAMLYRASWPYNVRDIESAIIGLIIEAHPHPVITLEHFRSDVLREVIASATQGRKRRLPEHVVHVFRATEENITRTAEVLGIGRGAVRSHLERAGISEAERKKMVKPGRRPRTEKVERDGGV